MPHVFLYGCLIIEVAMFAEKNPIRSMLTLALTTMANHYQYYDSIAAQAEIPEVKALLLILAETEGELLDRIRDMIATGIVEAVDEVAGIDEIPEPDATPFDLTRNDTDPRIFVCNKALEMELKGYTFFLTIAARAKSEVISRLFEYLAYIKVVQIERIRRVCSTF